MSDALQQIVGYKREEVAALLSKRQESDWLRLADESPAEAPRGFIAALRHKVSANRNALICELKRKSPSAGDIMPGADRLAVSKEYESGGAAALSVLTDGPSFGGTIDDLVSVRAAVSLPIIRKEFMVHPVQVHETRTYGADAILVILSAVDDMIARDLMAAADHHGLDVLMEVHDRAELDRAIALQPAAIGVNNRDLKRMVTDLETSEALAAAIPADTVAISESGIRTESDIERLRHSGFRTFLIGESLMLSDDRSFQTHRLSTAGTN